MVRSPRFMKSQNWKPSLEKQCSVLSLRVLEISSSLSKLKSLESSLLFIIIYQWMRVNINYEVILKNNHKLKGTIFTKIGEQVEDVKFRILEKEGFKSQGSFVCLPQDTHKITLKTDNLTFLEKGNNRKSSKIIEGSLRKMSSDSLFEQSSIDLQREGGEYLVREPEKPPLVRGKVQRCNRIFCCMTSSVYLELRVDILKFYNNRRYQEEQREISIEAIKRIRSFRKKQLYFISLELEEETLEFSFRNVNLCKEWMGYLIQAMEFSKYLAQKKVFSKAESFRQYMKTLLPQQNQQIVLLQESNQNLQTIHESLPSENKVERKLKKLIKLSEFQIEYKIGSGSFSIVYLARRNGEAYALKQLSKDKLLAMNQMKYALIELRALQRCRGCKYVIPLYFAFQTMDYLYLAIKYVSSGDLEKQIQAKGRFSNEEAFTILTELVYTIQYLHNQKIIYRDLKPENIMLDENGHIYLVDFGLAKELSSEDDYAESFLGTPLYLAPERFRGTGSINFKSDIYGVGCIFYQMLHGQTPFRGSNYQSLAQKIKNDKVEFRNDLPADFLSFLYSTLEKDPERRLSHMSRHIIFKNTNWKEIAARQHHGIKIEDTSSTNSVQITYRVDKDYNEETYPKRLVREWQFSSDSNL